MVLVSTHTSSPLTLNLLDPDTQSNESDENDVYLCPLCSFPCWLCGATEFGDGEVTGDDDTIPDQTILNETSIESVTGTSSIMSEEEKSWGWRGPRDKHSERNILFQLGVHIDRVPICTLYPTSAPANITLHDTRISSNVFLYFDPDLAVKISHEIIMLSSGTDSETARQVMVKCLTISDEDMDLFDNTYPDLVSSVCRDRWKPGKEGPPVPADCGGWDIQSDMTYMASGNLINYDLRTNLHTSPLRQFFADTNGVSPYLTIEFDSIDTADVAKYQIAASSVMWVYQRLRLKLAIGDGLPPAKNDLDDLRHYSIVFVSNYYFEVWQTSYDGKDYLVQLQGREMIDRPQGIEMYVKWWNAIQAWGLGRNAQSFKKDFEMLWEKQKNKNTRHGGYVRGASSS